MKSLLCTVALVAHPKWAGVRMWVLLDGCLLESANLKLTDYLVMRGKAREDLFPTEPSGEPI